MARQPKAARFEVVLSASNVRKLHRFLDQMATATGEAPDHSKAASVIQEIVEFYLRTYQHISSQTK
jgi:hypothetical protein